MAGGVPNPELLKCLMASLDAEPATRQRAEAHLREGGEQPGFGVELLKVALAQDVEYGIRQLAAVLVKQYVKEHWSEGERRYRPPTASDADKAAMRAMLPAGLADPTGKIRTAFGLAISSIAQWDWPQQWPDLLGILVRPIHEKRDPNEVNGALKALSLIAGDIEDSHMPEVVPVLFPELFTIISQPDQFDTSTRRRAFSVIHHLLGILGMMSGKYQKQVKAMMEPMLDPLLGQLAQVLSQPPQPTNMDDTCLKMESLRCLVTIVLSFPKLVEPKVPALMGPLWHLFVSSAPAYEAAVVAEEAGAGEVDEDGDEIDFEALVSQLFEFMLTVVGHKRYQAMIAPTLKELVRLTLGYMQMTAAQMDAWEGDANQYIADEEDDTVSVRASGEMLLAELIDVYGGAALTAMADGVGSRLAEAAALKGKGSPDWWKLREAVLLAVGVTGDKILETSQATGGSFDVPVLLRSVLQEDLAAGEVPPFLRGRALWTSSKLAAAVPPDQSLPFLHAAIAAIGREEAPLRIGGCRALSEYLPKCDVATVRQSMAALYQGLGSLLNDSTEETLHLVLETLQVAIRAEVGIAGGMAAQIAPAVLNIWAAHANDPLLSSVSMDVMAELAKAPGALTELFQVALPTLCQILASPQAQPPMLVEGALDVIVMLMRAASKDIARAVHGQCYGHVIALVGSSDDSGILQSCGDCLRAFVRVGGAEMLEWSDNGLQTLLDAVAQLLRPDEDEQAALHVGPLIGQMLRSFPDKVSPYLQQLLGAVILRLRGAQSGRLITSLIVHVFARLVHTSCVPLIDCLAGMPAPPAPPPKEGAEVPRQYASSLEFVLDAWGQWHNEVQGAYAIKLSTTALGVLLSSGHASLGQVSVRGKLVERGGGGGIRTRSRARASGPDQYTQVPFPVKVVGLLADALVEDIESKAAALAQEEADWETDDEDEGGGGGGLGRGPRGGRAAVGRGGGGGRGRAQGRGGHAPRPPRAAAQRGSDYAEDPADKADPINQVDLPQAVREHLWGLCHRDRAAFEMCSADLTPAQRQAVEEALGAPSPAAVPHGTSPHSASPHGHVLSPHAHSASPHDHVLSPHAQ